MTSPIDRAFIRAFAKRQETTGEEAQAENTAPAARTNVTRRIDRPEMSTAPAPFAWQETPFLVSSVDPDSLQYGSSLHIDVANDGYPEGLHRGDIHLLDDLNAMQQAEASQLEPVSHPAAEKAFTEQSAPVQPAVSQALRPEQVVRRLDEPEWELARPVVKPATIIKPDDSSALDNQRSIVVVEEFERFRADAEELNREQPDSRSFGNATIPFEPIIRQHPSAAPAHEQPRHESDTTPPAPTSPVVEQAEIGVGAGNHSKAAVETFPINTPFVPAWETDEIHWPRMVDRLMETDDRFDTAGRQLAQATKDDLRVLAVASTYRGEGRTTIAMNLTRAAAAHGVRVALVDADVDNPSLALSAGIEVEHGWHECLSGELPLDEAAVASLKDNVTIFPLTSAARRAPNAASGTEFRQMLNALSDQFDLIVVDYGPLGASESQAPEQLAGDAAMLVRDIRCTSAEQALNAVRRLRNLGLKSVGIIQNFT